MSTYTEVVETIEGMVTEFIKEAKDGETGHGSKTAAKKARKLSSALTKELKDFRKTSVENDKVK